MSSSSLVSRLTQGLVLAALAAAPALASAPSAIVSPLEPAPTTAFAAPAPVISPAETALLNAVNAATANWGFTITSVTVTTVGVVTSANEASMENAITRQAQYPKLSDTAPANLTVGLISSDPTIPAAAINAYQAGVAARTVVGDTVLLVSWQSPTAGMFKSYGVVSSTNQVKYETLMWTIPTVWPPAVPASFDATGPHEVRKSWAWTGKNGFGVAAFQLDCTAVAMCEGNTLVSCNCEHTAAGLAFGWAAQGTCSSTSTGNCCTAKCEFGYASGFKNVKVKAGGVGVEITGILGCSGTLSRTATACCGSDS